MEVYAYRGGSARLKLDSSVFNTGRSVGAIALDFASSQTKSPSKQESRTPGTGGSQQTNEQTNNEPAPARGPAGRAIVQLL